MSPQPGSYLAAYVGDYLPLVLKHESAGKPGWCAFLRTNLGRGALASREVIARAGGREGGLLTFGGASWRDIPLQAEHGKWSLDLAFSEVGFFKAKAYVLDPSGYQHWPDGPDLAISVLPDNLRTGNTIYCAFPRMFGHSRIQTQTADPVREAEYRQMESNGITVIPKSGTLRDVTAQLDHIINTLGCRILHLLPIGPVPTVVAKMGRFGSPYASQDLTAIDPALIDFDQQTTGVEQFCELADGVHLRGGQLFLDIVVNHTGWHSSLMESHPEWYQRNSDGTFKSPGAWGIIWGDLIELDNQMPKLWEATAESLLEWCRRGVDGFRCDAGYMVPLPAWQYIIAKVRERFPNTVFLLEGLGGAWEITESLLTEGGMQWAYSELFQNFHPQQVSGYMDHTLKQSHRMGPLVHYSETHDNLRLAAKSHKWSLMRNRLCALSSHSGAFGFTCGVEWLAVEKVDVHESRGMAWDNQTNIVDELSALNHLISNHPCFQDGASVERISPDDSWVLALTRHSANGLDRGLVIVNLDADITRTLDISLTAWESLGSPNIDLLGQTPPETQKIDDTIRLKLREGASYFLSNSLEPVGLSGTEYKNARARSAWAIQNLSERLPMELLGKFDWKELAELVDKNPLAFLAELPHLDNNSSGLIERIRNVTNKTEYPQALLWTPEDLNRVFLVPPDHSVLIRDTAPFEATIKLPSRDFINLRSIPAGGYQIASLPPITGISVSEDVRLELNRFAETHGKRSFGTLRYLSKSPFRQKPKNDVMALLTNGRGAMAKFHSDLGRITSKYDCALGANLHTTVPCDRHIFVKRVRAWVNADGFITPLNGENLIRFHAGPPVSWVFLGHAGDGRAVEIYMMADLMPKSNTLVILFERPDAPPERGVDLPDTTKVRLTVRLDLEDRSFHQETKRWDGADDYFNQVTTPNKNGFFFKPGQGRQLEAAIDSGTFNMEPEWSLNLHHAIEGTRGMTDSGDAWSPGWFEIELPKGKKVHLVITAEKIMPIDWADFKTKRKKVLAPFMDLAETLFEQSLMRSLSAYIVDRDGGSSVIAGYPWFLDWGRDTLIVCRGMIACGLAKEAGRILVTYAALEKNGTLPNMLCADSTANRDTSDAPLWLALASMEAANVLGDKFLQSPLSDGRKLINALLAIAEGYIAGTPNGIRVDSDSGLVWSPPHFTWMDTNYPASSPREGYPVEIQALWLCLLRLLAKALPKTKAAKWNTLAKLVESSLEMFWLEAEGYFADVLVAHAGCPAKEAKPADHLRPNQLFLISLGLVKGTKAQSAVSAAWRYLLIPGAMRSLAPLPVKTPLPVHAPWGAPLNDPEHPYWGHYEGDEDSRRKPAYHNGTAWVWPLGVFCEALAMAWPNDPAAKNSALAILGSIDQPFSKGCAGHLPEIMDGDTPHTPRGCDAQAWSLSEIIRAGKLINNLGNQ
jgi:predicted glycogen debranching enzyme